MKRIQTDFINILGIGAFAFFSILELCGLLEYVIRNILIITKTNSKIVLWLPEIISLILFIILIYWLTNKYSKSTLINTRNTLVKMIGLFFGVITLQFLLTYFGADVLMDKYPEEFDLYVKERKENFVLQSFIAFIPIIKYLIFGILLLTKKTVANN